MNGKIKVGLMGFGTVGTGVVRLVDSYKEDFLIKRVPSLKSVGF